MILHLILHNFSLISDPGTQQSVEHGDKLIQQLAQQDAMEQSLSILPRPSKGLLVGRRWCTFFQDGLPFSTENDLNCVNVYSNN